LISTTKRKRLEFDRKRYASDAERQAAVKQASDTQLKAKQQPKKELWLSFLDWWNAEHPTKPETLESTEAWTPADRCRRLKKYRQWKEEQE
jgi:hypothetical protein